MDEHFSEIVGVLVHIVALPRLVGAAKTPAVMATASVRIYRRGMSNFSSAIERPWPSHNAIDLDFVARGTMCSISVIPRSQGRLHLARWRTVRRSRR